MNRPAARCPTCGRAVNAVPATPWRPFCSERCRLLDLGAWLDGRRAIAGDPAEPEPDTHRGDETP